MTRVVRLEACHLESIEVQPAQAEELAMQGASVPDGGGWAMLDDAGSVVGVFGISMKWQGTGYAWALLSVHAGRRMVALTRAIRAVLDGSEFGRIEMAVDAEFPEAVRFAEMLGFTRETPAPMRQYFPNGRAAYLYARFKNVMVPTTVRGQHAIQEHARTGPAV